MSNSPNQGLRIILILASVIPTFGFLIIGAIFMDSAMAYWLGNGYWPTALAMVVVHFIVKTPFSRKVGDLEKIHFFSLWIIFFGSQVLNP